MASAFSKPWHGGDVRTDQSIQRACTRRCINLGLAIKKRAVMKGLVVFDYEDRRQQFIDMVAPLVVSGAIRYREDRVSGLENAAAHFERLMTGNNFGKSLVVVGEERIPG
jgi:NADPH-dependent curcumin reductase CurA